MRPRINTDAADGDGRSAPLRCICENTWLNVKQDNDTFLRYADQDMFAFVMLFNQARTQEDDRRMEEMTQELIDAALASGGRYYLPYRLHATKAQFEKAYPQARAWCERKRHYDPDGIFQNQFYSKYGLP